MVIIVFRKHVAIFQALESTVMKHVGDNKDLITELADNLITQGIMIITIEREVKQFKERTEDISQQVGKPLTFMGPVSSNLISITSYCYKLLKSRHLIGWEQIYHRNLAFVIDNKFYETGPCFMIVWKPSHKICISPINQGKWKWFAYMILLPWNFLEKVYEMQWRHLLYLIAIMKMILWRRMNIINWRDRVTKGRILTENEEKNFGNQSENVRKASGIWFDLIWFDLIWFDLFSTQISTN